MFVDTFKLVYKGRHVKSLCMSVGFAVFVCCRKHTQSLCMSASTCSLEYVSKCMSSLWIVVTCNLCVCQYASFTSKDKNWFQVTKVNWTHILTSKWPNWTVCTFWLPSEKVSMRRNCAESTRCVHRDHKASCGFSSPYLESVRLSEYGPYLKIIGQTDINQSKGAGNTQLHFSTRVGKPLNGISLTDQAETCAMIWNWQCICRHGHTDMQDGISPKSGDIDFRPGEYQGSTFRNVQHIPSSQVASCQCEEQHKERHRRNCGSLQKTPSTEEYGGHKT